jgi:tetratricopeptide (TPR) repeat protein
LFLIRLDFRNAKKIEETQKKREEIRQFNLRERERAKKIWRDAQEAKRYLHCHTLLINSQQQILEERRKFEEQHKRAEALTYRKVERDESVKTFKEKLREYRTTPQKYGIGKFAEISKLC